MDRIWGIGLAEDDERAWDESTWEGKNYLGYVITEVRDELMAEAGIIGNEDRKVGRISISRESLENLII